MAKKPEQMAFDRRDETDVWLRLSERIEKAIAIIQQLRRERDELRQQLTRAEGERRQGDRAGSDARALEEENERFRSERDEIRARLEKLLETLDHL